MPENQPRTTTGWALVATLVFFLAGCVTTETALKSAPVDPKGAAPQQTGGALLEDGRDGFIIKEVPKMNAAARNDFERAVTLLGKAQYEDAIVLLEKVIAQSPGVTAPYINLGMAYQHTGKPEKAEAQYQAALDLIPGHPVACNQFGLLYRKAGKFDQARAMYEQALAAHPNYYPVHRNLGILCDLYLNDLESALVHYEIYNRAMPEDAQVKLWIADLQTRMGAK
jgi:Tfp pilus assembly protein PilF